MNDVEGVKREIRMKREGLVILLYRQVCLVISVGVMRVLRGVGEWVSRGGSSVLTLVEACKCRLKPASRLRSTSV